MPLLSRIKELLQHRWVRATVISAVCFVILATLVLANGCVFYLNGNLMVFAMELTAWAWLLLLSVFVVKKWGRILLALLALAVFVLAPVCVLTVSPVVWVAFNLRAAAHEVSVQRPGVQAAYPASMPSAALSHLPEEAQRHYEFHYVAYGDSGAGASNHFRIEAVRRHSYCRALTNLTIFENGEVHATNENRPATASDEVLLRADSFVK